MKKVTIKVGHDKLQRRVSVNRPDTLAECKMLAGDTEETAVQDFWRGYSIRLQDRVLRPMVMNDPKVETAKLQEAVDTWDGLSSTRRVATVKAVITLPLSERDNKATEALRAALSAQGNEIRYSG